VTHETNGSDEIYNGLDPNGKLIIMHINGFVNYYIYNAQGDVIGLFSSAGTEVVTYEYDPGQAGFHLRNRSRNHGDNEPLPLPGLSVRYRDWIVLPAESVL
jgi:hypothetical protein